MEKFDYEKEIFRLNTWASELGLRIKTTKGYSDEEVDIFPDMIEPFFEKIWIFMNRIQL